MAHRHARATRLCALVILAVLVAWAAASATAGSPSSYTFTGTVSDTGNRYNTHEISVSAGSTVWLELRWHSETPNLQLYVYGPDGSLVGVRPGHRHPKHLSFIATQTGQYTAGVRAESGLSSYELAVTVTPDSAPVPTADKAGTKAGSSVVTQPISNDNDPDGDAIFLKSVGTPSNGKVVQSSGGNATYTPKAGWSGTDSFSYTVCDKRNPNKCAGSKVTVTVDPPPAPTPDPTPDPTPTPSGLRWAPPRWTAASSTSRALTSMPPAAVRRTASASARPARSCSSRTCASPA